MSMSTSTDTATETPKRSARGSRGVRGWFGRLPWPVRSVIVVVLAALAYLLPYVGRIPVIGPQIVTQASTGPARCSTCRTTCCSRSA